MISPNFVVGDVSNVDDCRRSRRPARSTSSSTTPASGHRLGPRDAVNLTAAHHLSELAERDLIARRGSIVTVASTAALVSGAVDADYNAAKAGLVMLSRSLAVRLGPHGVRANAVCPGWVRTPMGEEDMGKISETPMTPIAGSRGSRRCDGRGSPRKSPRRSATSRRTMRRTSPARS